MLKVKLLKQRKIFEISLTESRIYKKQQTSSTIREISDSNLETGRNVSKSGVSGIIQQSWQHCSMFIFNEYSCHMVRTGLEQFLKIEKLWDILRLVTSQPHKFLSERKEHLRPQSGQASGKVARCLRPSPYQIGRRPFLTLRWLRN